MHSSKCGDRLSAPPSVRGLAQLERQQQRQLVLRSQL
jgi:hypothetical protein